MVSLSADVSGCPDLKTFACLDELRLEILGHGVTSRLQPTLRN